MGGGKYFNYKLVIILTLSAIYEMRYFLYQILLNVKYENQFLLVNFKTRNIDPFSQGK